jgi:thiol-disulfide isomerase/thioredoxin
MLMQLRRSVPLWIVISYASAALAQQTPAPSDTQTAVQAAPSQSQVYAPNPSTKQMLDDAFLSAQKSGRRLLVIYEGSWCTHCPQLQQTIESAPDTAPLFRNGFAAVRVNADDFAGLQQFAQKLDLDLKLTKDNGPLLTIFEKDGTLLTSRTAAGLLDKGVVSAAKVAKFLNRWTLEAPAAEVYQKGLAELRSSGKLGWVEFGADWCVWCHRMDKFFDQSAAAPILHDYYVRIPVDYERNEGAPELAKQLGAPAGDGLPLWAVVDGDGKPLANSNSAKGNIGFPGTPQEIAEFTAVLQSTAKGITSAQLRIIEQALKAQKPD